MNEAVFKLTVSDLHRCQRCPRLLAYQKRGARYAWRVGIEGSGVGYGKLFHQHIAGAFHHGAFAAARGDAPEFRARLAEALKGAPEDLGDRLQALIRREYFIPFMRNCSGKLKTDQLMSVASATKYWTDCLADFLKDIPHLLQDPESVMGRVFCRPEQTLEAVRLFPDGKSLRVRGRYDALLFDTEQKQAALFEFKGFRSSEPTEELSQALTYAWLIGGATGIIPSVRVICLEDSAPLVWTVDQVKQAMSGLPRLFDAARQVLEGTRPLPAAFNRKLCRVCPFDPRCDADWGEREGNAPEEHSDKRRTAPRPAEKSEELQASVEDEGRCRMKHLLAALRELGIRAEDRGTVCGPCFIRLKIRPSLEKGIVKKIENAEQEIQLALSVSTPPMVRAQGGYISVDIPRVRRQILEFEDMMAAAEPTRPRSDAAFPLGLDIDGRVFWVDLTEPGMTAILIGGTSGSGKSMLLRSVVAGLTRCAPADSLRFVLVDPKRVTFTDMAGLRSLDEGRILMEPEEALAKLQELTAEMDDRYLKMEKARVSDISAFNSLSRDVSSCPMRRLVILIDEYADLLITAQAREALETAVRRLSQKGRAAGIHLLLATQRPDAKVVTGILKANLQLRVALKVISQVNSQIILDEGGAQHLLGNGDMLVGGSVPLIRLQGPRTQGLQALE